MYSVSQVFEMYNLIRWFIKTLAMYINQYVITKKYVVLHRPFKNCILQFKSNWLLCNKENNKNEPSGTMGWNSLWPRIFYKIILERFEIQKLIIMDFTSLWHGQKILINHSIYDLKCNGTWYAYFKITMQRNLVFKQFDVFWGNNDVDVLRKIV